MSNHIWRQGYGIDPMREWMRRELPGSSDGHGSGIVLIDLDLAVRRYGAAYGLDSIGDLLLVEKKEYIGKVTPGEKRVYDWLDHAVKSSEYSLRWRGNHVLAVQYTSEPFFCKECHQPVESDDAAYLRFKSAKLILDGKEITHDELRKLLDQKCHP